MPIIMFDSLFCSEVYARSQYHTNDTRLGTTFDITLGTTLGIRANKKGGHWVSD